MFVFGFILFSSCAAKISSAASVSTSSIERSQEILQEDKTLRQKIEQEEKFFVKTIIVKGVVKLSKEEIGGIILPFQGQWLTKKNIQQLIDSLTTAYAKKGIETNRIAISYKLKKDKTLEIAINDLTQ